MIKTFVNPIEETDEDKEEDINVHETTVINEKEVRLKFDHDEELQDSPLPKMNNHDFISNIDEEMIDILKDFQTNPKTER